MHDIQLHPHTPGTWQPFKPTGADAWRAEGEFNGRRMFIKVFAACGVTYGRTDWCWEIAEAEKGSWISRAPGAERSREEAVGEAEEAVWTLSQEGERRRRKERNALPISEQARRQTP